MFSLKGECPTSELLPGGQIDFYLEKIIMPKQQWEWCDNNRTIKQLYGKKIMIVAWRVLESCNIYQILSDQQL